MANIVDYQQLTQAKAETGKKFDEMIQNLTAMHDKITAMNESSWTGSSANVFGEVFEEIKTKINTEREDFNQAMDQRLSTWYNEFDETERQEAQKYQGL